MSAAMSVEMSMLMWSGVLLLVLILLTANANIMKMGLAWGVGNRDQAAETSGWGARAKRAYLNHLENTVVFAAIVLPVSLAGISNDMTVLGAQIFLAARPTALPGVSSARRKTSTRHFPSSPRWCSCCTCWVKTDGGANGAHRSISGPASATCRPMAWACPGSAPSSGKFPCSASSVSARNYLFKAERASIRERIARQDRIATRSGEAERGTTGRAITQHRDARSSLPSRHKPGQTA